MLIDTQLDEFFLIELRHFKPVIGGFERNGYIFTIIPPVPATIIYFYQLCLLCYN